MPRPGCLAQPIRLSYLTLMVDSTVEATVDAMDRQILRLLQQNGRMTIAALSDAVEWFKAHGYIGIRHSGRRS